TDGLRFDSTAGPAMSLRLRASVPIREHAGAGVAEFTLRAEESAGFVLEQNLSGQETPSVAPDYVAETFKETVAYWRRWVGRSSYRGRWRERVNRSAVTLKLLTSGAHGSIVGS